MQYDATRQREDTVLYTLTRYNLATQDFSCALCRQPVNPHEAFWWLQRGGIVNNELEFLPMHPACVKDK